MPQSPNKKNGWIPPNGLGIAKFAQVPPHIFLDDRLSAPQIHIFCLMCFHASSSGLCYMSQARLAELAGYFVQGEPNRQYISKLLRKLEEFGYVKNSGQRGYNKTNLYKLTVPSSADYRTTTDRQQSDDDYHDQQEEEDIRRQGFASRDELLAYVERETVSKEDENRQASNSDCVKEDFCANDFLD